MELSEAPVMEKAKHGYKKTEVGLIPVDWIVSSVGALARVVGRIGYRGYTENDIVEHGEGAIALSPSNIQSGAMNYDKRTHISWYKYEESPEIKIENGDILIVKIGSTVGKVALVTSLPEKATLNPQVVVLKNIAVNNVLLASLMNSRIVQDQMINGIVGGALPTLSQKQIASFVVPVPSTYEEQRAIATALTEVDGLLGGLDALIAKKKAIKQGAMQQLLTGKQRLPGFEGVWEVKRLGDIAEVVSGATPKTGVDAYWNGDILWCTPTDITGTEGKFIDSTERMITAEGLDSCNSKLLPVGSLLLCTRATIGELKIATKPICTNQGFKSLVCEPAVNNEFLYYKLLTMKAQMVEKAIGSTFLELSRKDAIGLELSVPNLEEQTAIATVLSDMDAELKALAARRAKTALLKQGMMQELLTGRTRLV